MSRMPRIVNYTCTLADTWYKIFDENDYKNNPIKEVKVKFREGSTAEHFRYAYHPDTGTALTFTAFMTSATGFSIFKDLKKLYVYVSTTAAQVIEIELLYR